MKFEHFGKSAKNELFRRPKILISFEIKIWTYLQGTMCSQEFVNELNGAQSVNIIFRKKHQFFISDFLHTEIPKRRRIWGMSRADVILK